MFKRTFFFATALFATLAFTPLPVVAQDDAEDLTEETSEAPAKKSKKKAKKPVSPVVTAVKKIKKVKGRVDEKCDYYIFLFSASWCGPCCKEMPEIVETYNKEIKKSGKVDIILFCQDKTPAAAKAFVNNFKIKFMTVMGSDDKCAKVPGYAPASGIPHCMIVDRYGRKITAGHPASILPSWEALTIEKGEPEAPETK